MSLLRTPGERSSFVDAKSRKFRLIIMAAGLAERFGDENKLLYPFQGEPLCLPVLRAASGLKEALGEAAEVITVSGHREVLDLARELGLGLCFNPRPEAGQSLSLRLGLEAEMPWDGEDPLPPEYAVFLTADLPFMTAGELIHFCRSIEQGASRLWRATDGERMGSPTAFDRLYYKDLAELRGDQGGRVIFRRYPEACGTVKLKARSLFDIDTKDDLRRAKAMLKAEQDPA